MAKPHYTARDADGNINWRVNMHPDEIRAWLKTPESKAAGMVREGETESVGRQSACKIIKILEQGGPKSLADWKHVEKVAGYNARHLTQKPEGDVRGTTWEHSMRNWGCATLKPGFDPDAVVTYGPGPSAVNHSRYKSKSRIRVRRGARRYSAAG